MSLSRLPISQDATLCLRIAGVAARISGLAPRIRADMFALLRPFVVAGNEPFATPAEIEVALRQTKADDGADDGAGDWEAWADGERLFRIGVYD
ncbi:MAG: hypothetical protein ACRDID_23205, partial [Ktedonobacterales bacterium]